MSIPSFLMFLPYCCCCCQPVNDIALRIIWITVLLVAHRGCDHSRPHKSHSTGNVSCHARCCIHSRFTMKYSANTTDPGNSMRDDFKKSKTNYIWFNTSYVPSTFGKFANPYPLQTVNTAAPMLTRLIVRTPALCFVNDRSFPSAAPMSAATTSRIISRYSVAADTGQVIIGTALAGTVVVDAAAEPGLRIIAAAIISNDFSEIVRRNFRPNLVLRRP